jgi:hypothetical protein
VLTTYGTLRRDIISHREIEFDYVVLDEAQSIKNAASQAAKACRLLRARHRLALTGTPVENHIGELWSIFEFLNPGQLGSATRLKRFLSGGRTSADVVARAVTAEEVSILPATPTLLRRVIASADREVVSRMQLDRITLGQIGPKITQFTINTADNYLFTFGKNLGWSLIGGNRTFHTIDRDSEFRHVLSLPKLPTQLPQILIAFDHSRKKLSMLDHQSSRSVGQFSN